MKIQFKIYHLRDQHGNEWAGVVNDPSEDVLPFGLKGRDGSPLHFEAEAYHLAKWAQENGLELAVYDREEVIDKQTDNG